MFRDDALLDRKDGEDNTEFIWSKEDEGPLAQERLPRPASTVKQIDLLAGARIGTVRGYPSIKK